VGLKIKRLSNKNSLFTFSLVGCNPTTVAGRPPTPRASLIPSPSNFDGRLKTSSKTSPPASFTSSEAERAPIHATFSARSREPFAPMKNISFCLREIWRAARQQGVNTLLMSDLADFA